MRLMIANAALVLALFGCSAPAQTAPMMPQATVTVQAPSANDADSRFDIAFVRMFEQKLGYAPSQDVIVQSRKIGRLTCEALRAGNTATQVSSALLNGRTVQEAMPALVAAGVGVAIWCPEYIKDFG